MDSLKLCHFIKLVHYDYYLLHARYLGYHFNIQYDFVDIQVTNFLIVSIILSSLDERLD